MSELTDSYIWRPQVGPQLHAINSRAVIDELFFGGARGGGKSDFLLGDFASDLDQGSLWQGVLFRRSFPELDEIIRRSFQLYPQLGGDYKVGSHEWRWPNGALLSFRHLDVDADSTHYQGHSFGWIGYDELPNWPTSYCYNALKATLRGPAEHKRIRATGNPGGIGHLWVREYFIESTDHGQTVHLDPETDMTRAYIPSKVADNRMLLDKDPNYIKRLKGVGDDALVQAWLDGDWDAVVGGYFPQFRRDQVLERAFAIPEHWPLFAAIDYGEASPSVLHLLAVDYDEVVHVVGEYYAAKLGAGEHADGMMKMITSNPWTGGRIPERVFCPPDMFTTRKSGEAETYRSPYDTFQEHGFWNLERANNDRINGWRCIGDALRWERLKVFHGWADHLVDTLPTLQRDPNKPEDVLKGGDDHAGDCLRYGMIHIYSPAAVARREVVPTGQQVLDDLQRTPAEARYGTA